MTREELLAVFEPVTDAIRNVLARTRSNCGESDIKRAAQRMGVLAGGKPALPKDNGGFGLLYDLALFEPNERGVRPFDRFLAGPARTLPPHERDIAQRIGGAVFSLFRFDGLHETGGVWITDVLDDDQRIWLMDTQMENREGALDLFAMRLFDAGLFHAGLGILVPTSEEMVRVCTTTQETLGRLPFPQSLAATAYGLMFLDGQPKHPSAAKFLHGIAKALEDHKLIPPSAEGETTRMG